MPRQSKRTSAPAPMETPSSPPRPRPPPHGAQRVPPAAAPSMFAPDTWCSPCPPQSMVPPSTTYWMPGSSPQGPWWTPPSSANMEQSDLRVWGVDSNPPGGFLNFLNKNTPEHVFAQAVNNGSSSQPINVGDDSNGSDCPRTEKRMLWRKDEDITLVGGWLNNSSDPIHANYKKNDQYWKEVTTAYNSAIPKNRARLMKCIKDRFGRIKKGCMVLWQLEGGKCFVGWFLPSTSKGQGKMWNMLLEHCSPASPLFVGLRVCGSARVLGESCACVILHNMIVEDEKEEVKIHIDLNTSSEAAFALPPEVNVGGNLCFADVLRRKASIHSQEQHTQLKKRFD